MQRQIRILHDKEFSLDNSEEEKEQSRKHGVEMEEGNICSNFLQGCKNDFLCKHRYKVNYYFLKVVNSIEIYLRTDLIKQLANKIK